MATAEVLPIVLEGTDKTASAWASFIRNAKGGQSAVDQVKAAMAGFSGGSVSSLSQIGTAARMLANPYVAVTALVVGLGGASLSTARDMAKIGDVGAEVGVRAASSIVGLGDALVKVGGDAGDAAAGLKNLRSQLDINSRDGGYLENLFKLNKSSITDAAGNIKPLNDIYKQLAGYINNAKNDTEALEIATNAFGAKAAPDMVKAIKGGATSLDAMAKTDLDPIIQQSRQIAKIWEGASGGDGWLDRAGLSWDKLKDGFAQAGNNISLAAARIRGAPGADMLARQINGAGVGTSTPDTEYPPIGPYTGTAPRTVTPSNRPDPAGTAAFDKASIAIAKHTAETLADTAAVDLGAGALAEMQTEAKLLATAQEAGLPITQKMRDKIQDLAQDSGDAAAALAKAKTASEINFTRGTAFLTADDVAIATSLKGIYGTDIPAALGSTEAAAMRMNNIFKEISSTGQDVNRGLFVDFTSKLRSGTSAWDSFSAAGLNALGKISDKLSQMAADQLWKAAFPGGGGSFLSLLGIGTGSKSDSAAGVDSITDPTFAEGGFTGSGGKNQPAGIVHKGEFVFDQAATSRIGVAALARLQKGYADGGPVGDLSPADIMRSGSGGASATHVSVGVSVDDDGNLQAYVKDISAKSADRGINSFVQSPAFIGHVAVAAGRARQQRKLF